MIKTVVKAILYKVVNRYRFMDSPLYNLYHYLFRLECAKANRDQMHFYQRLLGGQSMHLIFDVGANHGDKSKVFSELARTVISIEPNAEAVRALEQRFARTPNVHKIAKACGARECTTQMHLFGADAYNTLSAKWVNELAQEKNPLADHDL
jgi:hypothetical protein